MTGSTPMSRLRERHRGFHYCDGGAMATEQRCDTIAALEELEALPLVSPADLESLDMSMQSIIRHAEGKETEIRALQARINEAAGMFDSALWWIGEDWLRDRIRAWLAGGPCPICGNAGVDAQGYECSCKEERQ